MIRPPHFSPWRVGEHLRHLFHYRDLLLTLTHHRIRVRYKQSMLGLGWALLQPLSLMLIYTVIFSVVTKMPSDGAPYSIFVYTALLPWTFFSNGLTSGSGGLVGNQYLVTKVYFPREILPLSYVLAALFDLAIASAVLGGMMIYYRIPITPHVLWAAPIIGVMIVFLTAIAILLSAIQVWFRDIGLAMPLLLQLWMFASPVVYPLNAVPAHLRDYYVLNPMVGVVENFRRVILQAKEPEMHSLVIAAAISLIALPVSYAYFKQREATMADII